MVQNKVNQNRFLIIKPYSETVTADLTVTVTQCAVHITEA